MMRRNRTAFSISDRADHYINQGSESQDLRHYKKYLMDGDAEDDGQRDQQNRRVSI